MSTYPLVVIDRKHREVRFSNREELTAAASDLDTVTAGKVLSALHEGKDFDLWASLYDAHHGAARLRVRLGRVMVAWLNKFSREGDERHARLAFHRVGGSADFDDWWNERQIELAGEAEKPPVEVAPVERKAEKKRTKRVLAHDEGPKKSLGKIYVETRSFSGEVEDYFGDGSYRRTCPKCKTSGTYSDFGARLMIRGGVKCKIVQPQCSACRREASRLSRAKKAAG